MSANLIERLEKLTGPSREVDARLWCLVNGYSWRGDGFNPSTVFWALEGRHGNTAIRHVPRYTASLDAIVALIEQKLPGCLWGVEGAWEHNGKPVPACAEIYRPGMSDMDYMAHAGATPAIAACIALLKAIEAGQ